MSAFRLPEQRRPSAPPWHERAVDWLLDRAGVFVIIGFLIMVVFWALVGFVAWHFLGRYW